MSALLNGLSCCIVAGQGEVAEISALFEKLGGKRAWAGSSRQEILLSTLSAVEDPVNRDRIAGLEGKGLKIIDAIAWLKECSRKQQRVPHLPYVLRLPEEQLPHATSSISFFDEESSEAEAEPDLEEIEKIEQQTRQVEQQQTTTTPNKEVKASYFQPAGLPAGASNSATLAKFGPSRPIGLPGGGFVRKATLEEIASLDSILHDFRVLHMCSMDENKNKYYILELTERGPSHLIITHYGRVGEPGTYEVRMFRSAADAKSYFGQLCTEKYVKKGYRDMALDSCFVGTKKLQATISAARSGSAEEIPSEPSRQSPPCNAVLSMVETIYADANEALSTVLGAQLTSDGIRTEVGVLNSEQIRRASSILDQVQAILYTPGGSSRKKDLLKLSHELYSTIPHKLSAGSVGCAVQPIASISDLTEKRDLLQLMTDVTNAQVQNALSNTTTGAHQKYSALGCSIEALNPAAEEFRKLQKIVENDVRKCGISLKKAFRVTRPSELAEFEKNISGRRDLLHGTKASNVLGILRRGLLLPPTSGNTRQRTNFGWLGSGIYFSDTPCSITRYSDPSSVTGSSFAFVCQVACGVSKQVVEYSPHLEAAPFGFDSVQGMGSEMPSAAGSVTSSVFRDNEIVVYRRSQFTIDYLLELTVERRLPKPKDPPVNTLPSSAEPAAVLGMENDDDRIKFGDPPKTSQQQNPFSSGSQGGGFTFGGVNPGPFTTAKPQGFVSAQQTSQQSNPFGFSEGCHSQPSVQGGGFTFGVEKAPSAPLPAANAQQASGSNWVPGFQQSAPKASPKKPEKSNETNPFASVFAPDQGMADARAKPISSIPDTPFSVGGSKPDLVTSKLSDHEQRLSLIERSVAELRKSQATPGVLKGPVSFGAFPQPAPASGMGFTSGKLTKFRKTPVAVGKGKGKGIAKTATKVPTKVKACAKKPVKVTRVKACAKMANVTDPDRGITMKPFRPPKAACQYSADVSGQLEIESIPADVNKWIVDTEKDLRTKFASGFVSLGKYEFLLNVYSRSTLPTFVREKFTAEEAAAGKILTQYVQNQHIGCASILPKTTFTSSLDDMTSGQLKGLDWSNIVMAGGCVLGALLPHNIGTGEAFRGSDMDLFVYGCATDPQAQQVIERVIACVQRNRMAKMKKKVKPTIMRTPHAVTIIGEYPYRHVQIVLRMYQSPAEVLLGFDVDSCAVAYDGTNVWASPRARRAINKQVNTVDLTRRSLTYEVRLAKYARRGFGVLIPNFDENYSIRQTKPVKELNGLAKLLALDRDETIHCTTRRNGWHRQRRMKARGRVDYSGSTDDEKVLPSDYCNVFLPWGPNWGSWGMGKYLENRDKKQYYCKVKTNPSYHAHIAVIGEGALDGFASWCPKCQAEKKKAGGAPSQRPSKEQVGWDHKSDKEMDKEAASTFVFGKPNWMRDNPGTQLMTSSFHPIDDDKWADGTKSSVSSPYIARSFLRPRIDEKVWMSSARPVVTHVPPQAQSTPVDTNFQNLFASKKAFEKTKTGKTKTEKKKTFSSPSPAPAKAKASTPMPPLLVGATLMDDKQKLVKKFGTILEIQSVIHQSGKVVGEGNRIVSFSLNDTLIVPSRADRKYSNTDTDWKLKYDRESMQKTLTEAAKSGAKLVIFADQPGIGLGYVSQQTAVSRIINILETLAVPDVICYLSTESDVCKKPSTAMFDLFLHNHKLHTAPSDMLYVGSKSTEYDAVDWKFAKNCNMEFDQPDAYFNNAAPEPEPTMAFMPNTVTQVVRLWEDQGRAGQTTLRIPEVVKDAELDCSPSRFGIVLSGIPKGGKSLYARSAFRGRNFVVTEYHPAKHADDQRLHHEARLMFAVRMGASVVFDGQNTTVEERKQLLDLIKRLEIVPVSVHINTPPAVARHLNQVGFVKDGVRSTDGEFDTFCRVFQQPDESEGFDHLETIPFTPCFENVADEMSFYMFP